MARASRPTQTTPGTFQAAKRTLRGPPSVSTLIRCVQIWGNAMDLRRGNAAATFCVGCAIVLLFGSVQSVRAYDPFESIGSAVMSPGQSMMPQGAPMYQPQQGYSLPPPVQAPAPMNAPAPYVYNAPGYSGGNNHVQQQLNPQLTNPNNFYHLQPAPPQAAPHYSAPTYSYRPPPTTFTYRR